MASRAASASVLGFLAEHIDNMIVSSADLANSDKTDGFLTKTQPALSCAAISRARSSRWVSPNSPWPASSTVSRSTEVCSRPAPLFFVFSDYMKPAIRMAALQELPVKFIYSHDSFHASERMVPLTNPSSRRHRYVLWSRCAISAAVPPCS